jgi:hypothetical protein
VGYNVLCRADLGAAVRRYVTVGSPLGVRAISRKLDKPLRMPPGVTDWSNAMDDRDVVALCPLDGAYFPISPPIRNKCDVDNFTSNRHGIEGYLSDPDVARWIHRGLTA